MEISKCHCADARGFPVSTPRDGRWPYKYIRERYWLLSIDKLQQTWRINFLVNLHLCLCKKLQQLNCKLRKTIWALQIFLGISPILYQIAQEVMSLLFVDIIYCEYYRFQYNQSSYKRPPQEFRKEVATRAGRLQEVDHEQSLFSLRNSCAKWISERVRIVTWSAKKSPADHGQSLFSLRNSCAKWISEQVRIVTWPAKNHLLIMSSLSFHSGIVVQNE